MSPQALGQSWQRIEQESLGEGSMPMEVHIREDGPASVVEFVGALDTSLPAEMRRDIVALIKPGRHLILDMSRLRDVSGTGLRMLLLLIRAAQAVGRWLQVPAYRGISGISRRRPAS
jgi:hypothetical protein